MEPYTSKYLIDRLYIKLAEYSIANKKLVIDKPEISCANKKTFIANFKNICDKIQRRPDDVKAYFEKELNTQISINQNGSLIITGMFKPPGILKVLGNYISEYVTCKECSSCETKIVKENRITFLECNKCLSKRAFTS